MLDCIHHGTACHWTDCCTKAIRRFCGRTLNVPFCDDIKHLRTGRDGDGVCGRHSTSSLDEDDTRCEYSRAGSAFLMLLVDMIDDNVIVADQ